MRAMRNRDICSNAMTSPSRVATTSVTAEMNRVISDAGGKEAQIVRDDVPAEAIALHGMALRRDDRAELVFLGSGLEPAVKLDGSNEQIDVVEPDLVALVHDVSVGRHR